MLRIFADVEFIFQEGREVSAILKKRGAEWKNQKQAVMINNTTTIIPTIDAVRPRPK